MTRRRMVSTLFVLVALWAALALAREVRHLQWRHAGDRWFVDEPCLWRYGTPPTDRLERFLDAVRPVIDQAGGGDGTVYFRSPFDGFAADDVAPAAFFPDQQDGLCAYLWAAYLLPEMTLRRPQATSASAEGSLWLLFGAPAGGAPEGFEPVVSTEDGVLGRIPR